MSIIFLIESLVPFWDSYPRPSKKSPSTKQHLNQARLFFSLHSTYCIVHTTKDNNASNATQRLLRTNTPQCTSREQLHSTHTLHFSPFKLPLAQTHFPSRTQVNLLSLHHSSPHALRRTSKSPNEVRPSRYNTAESPPVSILIDLLVDLCERTRLQKGPTHLEKRKKRNLAVDVRSTDALIDPIIMSGSEGGFDLLRRATQAMMSKFPFCPV
ncbi:hypothetical protein F5B20DRAFT_471939 [Whalleya microplaca]|nr:hypothetical protein F5B20DRAFT_471939 [Whalleya microplaca]